MTHRQTPSTPKTKQQALLFDIKRDCSEDGPGIRTTVFFKGCPLACLWCHNPEGLNAYPEIDSKGNSIGYWIELEELVYRVLIDKPFYTSTQGGVTLSGGEPTAQMEFAHEFLKELKAHDIHTAIETSGLFNFNRFKSLLLPYLDLIYFDLKLFNDTESRQFSGRSNKPILRNFERLVLETDANVIPRIPLIPGITTSTHNLTALSKYLEKLDVKHLALMPYNPMWVDKSISLGRIPAYDRRQFMTQQETNACIKYFRHIDKGEIKCK